MKGEVGGNERTNGSGDLIPTRPSKFDSANPAELPAGL
ncbi:hypothetical protein KOR42_26430 [Thalassoglobus neptunius]|uniref:Uncharacterized protein n=1 Tax=Thalassoglobus neptunius TaxID=1938619 RepID=A0A5C5X0V1_9PLAN|nr:hypothetical protein KOR42_26430 [Thalassoglobus neptunius]